MLLSGFAFGLTGLELGVVLDDTGDGWPRLLGVASVVVAVVVVLRLVWLMTTLSQRLARADPKAADEDAKAQGARDLKLMVKIRDIQSDVLEAGRREALAARREPGMPTDLVDRVTRRLDLGRR